MNVLGIETATEVCSVGLAMDSGVTDERSIIELHIHSEKLLTLVDEILRSNQIGPKDLDAVAVSIGPGSFSGLRIGMSSAKGFCEALGIPLVTIPTFTALAIQAIAHHSELSQFLIALDAKQGEYYWGEVANNNGKGFPIVSSISITSLEGLAVSIGSNRYDALYTDQYEKLGSELNSKILVKEIKKFYSGRTIAALGLRFAKEKKFANVEESEPFYLKDFVVRTNHLIY